MSPRPSARVVLGPKRARPFFGQHPWVYPGAIAAVEGEPADGDVVDLCSHAGNFIARGLYNSQSKIRVRLFSWNDVPLDEHFFRDRLQAACHLRHAILGLGGPSKACRLVFSESDGLSGCVVDQYDRWLVLQFTSLGLAQRREIFCDLLTELIQPEGIYLRTERGIGQLEGLDLQDTLLRGNVPTEPIAIDDHGVKFLVHLREGQKTGFYLDQRDNRLAVAQLAKGRRMLDCFCYTGGFGLHALRAGAESVLGIDAVGPGPRVWPRPTPNLTASNGSNVSAATSSMVWTAWWLRMPASARLCSTRPSSLVPVMPWTRPCAAIGVCRVRPCVCWNPTASWPCAAVPGLIALDMLHQLLAQLAAEHKRPIQILESRGPAADHPVAANCLETGYLKCILCRVR